MAYEYLSDIYDEHMSEGQQQWAAYLMNMLRPYATPPAHVLDMGCGTGGISIPLAKAGFMVTAVDSSQAMLARAAEKARQQGVYTNIKFVLENAAAFQVGNSVDAVIAACDVANYLPPRSLSGFMGSAKRALKPGAPLLFDISSTHYYEDILGSGIYVGEAEHSLYIMRTEYVARRCQMDVTFFALQPDGSYKRRDEHHELFAHGAAEVLTLLENHGYNHIACYGFLTNRPADGLDDRIQFFARA